MITPLPWIYAPTGVKMQSYSQPFGIGAGTQLVAGVFGDVSGGWSQAEENARFIVKACNNHHAALNALKDYVETIEKNMKAELYHGRELIRRMT
jgi:hypothetical protein